MKAIVLVLLLVGTLNIAPGWGSPNAAYVCHNPAGHVHHCRTFR